MRPSVSRPHSTRYTPFVCSSVRLSGCPVPTINSKTESRGDNISTSGNWRSNFEIKKLKVKVTDGKNRFIACLRESACGESWRMPCVQSSMTNRYLADSCGRLYGIRCSKSSNWSLYSRCSIHPSIPPRIHSKQSEK